jgi:hypothetical protein
MSLLLEQAGYSLALFLGFLAILAELVELFHRNNGIKDVRIPTHICFMYDSMRHGKRVMLWELPLISLRSLAVRSTESR